MQFKGVLNVTVASEKNRSGQRPISVEFVGEDGIALQTIGARLTDGMILDAVAVVKGTSYKHTAFSPALQTAIMAAGKGMAEIDKTASDDYQERLNKKYGVTK